MIFKIAWRNIWRNKLRSLVVMIAIFLGVWSGIFINALSLGMTNQRTENFLSTSVGHIQIHHPDFLEENKLNFSIPNFDELNNKLQKIDGANITNRIRISGMISSANGASGGNVLGITPEDEIKVSTIHNGIKEGEFLGEYKKNRVVIGAKLAHKLKVKINSKIIVTFQDQNNEIIASAFRVQGIYKTANTRFDEMNVFVYRQDLERILQSDQLIHESVLWMDDKIKVDSTVTALANTYPNLKVRSWKDIAPDLAYTDDLMIQMLYIIMIIILGALAFGIVNTMLMAILERQRELGMLMAVGMNKLRLFMMVVVETIMLSLISGPAGLIISFFTVEYFKRNGMDFSAVGQGLEDVGYSTIVYFEMQPSFYWSTLVLVIITAILSSLYPAFKALKLNPVESIRGL